ncbi:MAG: hypothetical protein J6K17_13215 [Oscillospiraceae bacterium]|nr:hypothetical protein [Oscillospiraceae bacterium]
MNVLLKLFFKDGTILETDKIIGFRCVKERYTPYSSLTVTAETECVQSDVVKVDFSVGGKDLHSGITDSVSVVRSCGRSLLKITSRGFSSMLAQNEIEPGTLTLVSLDSLMSNNLIVPNVTWQSNSETVRYIYVKEHDSQWTAITCLGLTLYEDYPYIGKLNEVRLSPADNPLVITTDRIFEEGIIGNYSRMVSDYHMKDVNGSYTYHYSDGFSEERGIIRHKYVPYDRQYVALDHLGLQYKLNFTERGCKARFASYLGYNGEELRDRFVFPDGANCEISAVEICGNAQKGIFTKVVCYFDRYCNI